MTIPFGDRSLSVLYIFYQLMINSFISRYVFLSLDYFVSINLSDILWTRPRLPIVKCSIDFNQLTSLIYQLL